MPTDKPYTVSVRLKQHKATRRVPTDETKIGSGAVVLVVDSAASSGSFTPDDIEVYATTHDGKDIRDGNDGIALWLALGLNLASRASGKVEKFLYSSVLGAAATILENPAAAMAMQQMLGAAAHVFEEATEKAVVEQAKKTSTEGSN